MGKFRLKGNSIDTWLHFVQTYLSKEFKKFDYGEKDNLVHYGQPTPPKYDLKKVTAPVGIIWGQNDFLAVPEVSLFHDSPSVMHLSKHDK